MKKNNGQKRISIFVTEAINRASKEQKETLKISYIESEQDQEAERKDTIDDWSQLDSSDDWE
jgi:hypothetical protein